MLINQGGGREIGSRRKATLAKNLTNAFASRDISLKHCCQLFGSLILPVVTIALVGRDDLLQLRGPS